MEYFDEDFAKSLPDDWAHAALMISDKLSSILKSDRDTDSNHTAVRELWALLKVLNKKRMWPIELANLDGKAPADINFIQSHVDTMRSRAESAIRSRSREDELSYFQNVHEIALGDVFHFEFSEGDLERIQKLTDELRKLISDSGEIEEKYKQRLLRKLERFQSELHKKVSDLDRAWGFLLEASSYIGQMGKNVKPMVDRIVELGGIIAPAHARAYDLPTNLPVKLLETSQGDKD